MCVFCAAIPATFALVAAGQTKQTRSWRHTSASEPLRRVPISAVALAAALGLVLIAGFYHSRWPTG